MDPYLSQKTNIKANSLDQNSNSDRQLHFQHRKPLSHYYPQFRSLSEAVVSNVAYSSRKTYTVENKEKTLTNLQKNTKINFCM